MQSLLGLVISHLQRFQDPGTITQGVALGYFISRLCR
jgi:hypothetical protein